jgi:glycosyltransferase involved in cell wall biosynthesis
MKVAAYFRGYPPEKCGGYTFEQDIVHRLCELFPQCRHEMVLFFEDTMGDDILIALKKEGLRAITLVPLTKWQQLQRLILKTLGRLHPRVLPLTLHPLRSVLLREKVEMIWFVADAYVPPEEVEVPYIATVWDIQHRLQPWFPEVSQSGMWKSREDFYSTFLRRAAFILTPNEIGRNELCLFYGLQQERFRMLPLPAPKIENFPGENELNNTLLKYKLDRGYLFYPAGFWPHKNHANLLLALQVLKDKFKQKRHLVLVGPDKGNLNYIRNLTVTLGLEEQVHFLGFITRKELIALYQGAFALTYMSLFGPDNLPPLEAFSFGCPVIVADYSGARQQCGNAAVFVNALDPYAIATAIYELQCQPEFRLELLESGRKRAVQYTGETYVKDVFSIFDEFEKVRRTWGSIY